jgi:hypothetical protein
VVSNAVRLSPLLRDLGEVRITMPEDRAERAQRHLLARQMADPLPALIAIIRTLDPDVPLTAILEACAVVTEPPSGES